MSEIRRINIFGGPCTGKSVIATYLFYRLKAMQHSIEYVHEYIKFWTYIPRVPKGWDSVYCQAKQIHHEDTVLRSGTNLIVSDSPLHLQCFYAEHHENPGLWGMLEQAKEFESEYPSINIFLKRKDEDYKEEGRYETLEQAKQIDKEIEEYREFHMKHDDYVYLSYTNMEEILDYVVKKLGE